MLVALIITLVLLVVVIVIWRKNVKEASIEIDEMVSKYNFQENLLKGSRKGIVVLKETISDNKKEILALRHVIDNMEKDLPNNLAAFKGKEEMNYYRVKTVDTLTDFNGQFPIGTKVAHVTRKKGGKNVNIPIQLKFKR